MKKIIITFGISIFLFIVLFVFVQAQNKQGKLQIIVDQFNNDDGQAMVLVYRENDNLFKPESAFKSIHTKIINGKVNIQFENLSFGIYAVIAVHDENNNGKTDHYWYGFPKEQLGFSNNFQLSITSGKPNFKKLAFTFSETNTVQNIHLGK